MFNHRLVFFLSVSFVVATGSARAGMQFGYTFNQAEATLSHPIAQYPYLIVDADIQNSSFDPSYSQITATLPSTVALIASTTSTYNGDSFNLDWAYSERFSSVSEHYTESDINTTAYFMSSTNTH